MFALALLCVDPTLSRVDAHSLPDQVRMELFLEQCNENFQNNFRGKFGDFTDVCTWPLVTCDTDENVIKVHWQKVSCFKSVSLDLLPLHLKHFSLAKADAEVRNYRCAMKKAERNRYMQERAYERTMSFQGTLETTALPRTVSTFNIACNRFQGSLNLSALPDKLELFDVSANRFTGKISLDALPQSIIAILLERNRFQGSVNLGKLPQGIAKISLHENEFVGELKFENIPASLRKLTIHGNKFAPIDEIDLPEFVELPKKDRRGSF